VSALVAEVGDLGLRAQIIAVIGTVLFLVLVIELVRRRRLVERYALLWITAAIILVILSLSADGLRLIAEGLGIRTPVNALFLLGLGTVFVLALHFSVAFSRLSEETKILAQEVARLDGEQRHLRGTTHSGAPVNGSSPDAEEEAGAERGPVADA
jgi:hypothetical protein